ncbi:MAG: tryptophan synthase subunit alpha, partial [Myxococcota bacterium]
MGRLASVFERTRSEGRAALITYLCAGDPDLEQTIDRVVAAGDAGADIVELGIPFSDPTADGIAIQQASERALASGTTVKKILDAVVEIRKRTSIPIMLFGYYNPILAFGEERLAREAASAGVDGVLVVDLPPEEAELLRGFLVDQHLDLVPLVAPTSTDARIDAATRIATSFLYCVSVTGV